MFFRLKNVFAKFYQIHFNTGQGFFRQPWKSAAPEQKNPLPLVPMPYMHTERSLGHRKWHFKHFPQC